MISFKTILALLFALLVCAIIVLGLISYSTMLAIEDSSQRVQYNREVIRLTDEISSLSKDLQMESNGLFISRDSIYIMPYFHARSLIRSRLKLLGSLIAENPQQILLTDSLEILVNDLLVFGDSALTWDNALLSLQEKHLNRVGRANYLNENFTYVINEIKAEENCLLSIHEQEKRRSMAAFDRSFLLLFFAIITLLVAKFFIINYNFNNRIRIERELKNARDLFSKLFNESPVGLMICEADSGVITDCNHAYAALINHDRQDIIGKTVLQLQIVESDIHAEEAVNGVEVLLKPEGKDPIWTAVSIQPIDIQNTACFMTAVVDISLHKQAEQRVLNALAVEVELSKMKSDFMAMASHEFRTPLTTILSSTYLLEMYLQDEKQRKVNKHVKRIKSSVNDLTLILDEFLLLTKIEEGKVEPRIEKLNLESCIQKICSDFEHHTKPGQNIIYTHKGDPLVCTDMVLLETIIRNLISNAIKYSPENSNIFISSNMGDNILLAVKDFGVGIPKEDQKYLFKRFYRASNAKNIQGTGLGLHIMKYYVEILNGTIEVKSELGKGAEFKVEIQNCTTSHEKIPAHMINILPK